MYDIIGDIHGYCGKLKELLKKMDYTQSGGVWKHPERKVIFVGDYIDRGPEIRETLQLVRNMVEAGAATALMGNHEFNAVAFNRLLDDGTYLRKHTTSRNNQHRKTLEQFDGHEAEWRSHLEWFYSLPLFLDLEKIRVVHACWDEAQIAWLKDKGYHTLNDELLLAAHEEGSVAEDVINDTLKGKEFNLPEGYVWNDKDGYVRKSNRTKWWKIPAPEYYGELLFDCPPQLAGDKLPSGMKVSYYPHDAPPVFFGHYWLEDSFPIIQSENVICLDYSVAKNGYLAAYRWDEEKTIDNKHFVWGK